MNLDDLTLGQIKQLKALLGSSEEQKQKHPDIGQKVIIRTYSAGVHYGTLIQKDNDQVILQDAIRIWKWAGAFTLSELATFGTKKPNECKFSKKAIQISLTMIEIIRCTQDGITSIEGVIPHEP